MLRLRFFCFFAAIILGSTFQHASAAEPTIDQKIEILMKGIDFDRQKRAVLSQVSNTFEAANLNLPEPLVERMTAIIVKNYADIFSDPKHATIDIYKSTYSSDEIDAMYEFYTTPIGSKILDKNPLLFKEIENYMTPNSIKFMDKSVREIESDPEVLKYIQEYRKSNQ